MFTLHGSLASAVKQFIPEMNTKGAKIAGQEWDIILVAVPAESLYIAFSTSARASRISGCEAVAVVTHSSSGQVS